MFTRKTLDDFLLGLRPDLSSSWDDKSYSSLLKLDLYVRHGGYTVQFGGHDKAQNVARVGWLLERLTAYPPEDPDEFHNVFWRLKGVLYMLQYVWRIRLGFSWTPSDYEYLFEITNDADYIEAIQVMHDIACERNAGYNSWVQLGDIHVKNTYPMTLVFDTPTHASVVTQQEALERYKYHWALWALIHKDAYDDSRT